MDIIKKIKFRAPSKVSLKGDDFLSKLKPVLGQNQINPASFVNDFNKKTENLSDGVELLAQIHKMQDKSCIVVIKNFSPALLAEQLSTTKKINVKQLQDIIKIKTVFDNSTDIKNIAKAALTALQGYTIQK